MEMFKHFWQAQYNNYGFELYGGEHLAVIFVFLALAVFLILARDKLSERVKKQIRVTSSAAAIVFDFFFHVWSYLNHEDFLGSLLPFHLCDVSLVLSLAFNLGGNISEKKRQKFFELIYFWSVGAISALTFPTLAYGANKFRFYHFFAAHSYIVLTMVYGLAVEKRRVTFSSYLSALKSTMLLAVFALAIDRMIDRNYMFLLHAPETPSPLDMLGEGLEYYVGFAVMASLIMFLFYLPFGAANLIKARAKAPELDDERVDI